MDNRDRIHTQTARTCLQNTLAMDAELATDSTEMFRACIYTAQDIGRESGRLGHMHTVCALAEQREHAAGKASTNFLYTSSLCTPSLVPALRTRCDVTHLWRP